jgi:hypothetical protein
MGAVSEEPAAQSTLQFVRAACADAALALTATVVIGLVIASLAAAGIITMSLAYVLLGLAWFAAVSGSFLAPWQFQWKHRTLFAVPPGEDFLTVHVFRQNIGNADAIWPGLWSDIRWVNPNIPDAELNALLDEVYNSGIEYFVSQLTNRENHEIHPQEIKYSTAIRQDVPKSIYIRFLSGEYKLYFLGAVWYTDENTPQKKFWRSEFCFYLYGGVATFDCQNHHSISMIDISH